MSLRHRLKHLEEVRQEKTAIWLLCVDKAGIVLDDGTAAIGPWGGKHHSAVPGCPKVIVGVDPLMVLGLRPVRIGVREGT